METLATWSDMMHLVALKFDSTRNKLKPVKLNLFISTAPQQMHLLCGPYGPLELPQAEFIQFASSGFAALKECEQLAQITVSAFAKSSLDAFLNDEEAHLPHQNFC